MARKAFPFLADPCAPPGLVELVAAQLQLRTFEKGEAVYRQGEASTREWFYVVEGAAEKRRRVVVDEASTPPSSPSSNREEDTDTDTARRSSDAVTAQSASPTSSSPSAPPTTDTQPHATKSPVGTPAASDVKSTDGAASVEAASAEQEEEAASAEQEEQEAEEEAQEVTALLPQESTFGLDMAPLEELVKSIDQEATMEEARRRALVITAGREERSERGWQKVRRESSPKLTAP